jgi:hypothetical protein
MNFAHIPGITILSLIPTNTILDGRLYSALIPDLRNAPPNF